MPKSDVAVLLALAAALASAVGNVVRQRSAHEVTDKPVGYFALFRMSWRNRYWRLGALAAIANYGLQAAALSLGSVILVTGLQVTALLFALPIYARMTRHPVSRWDWTWATLLAAALAVVVTVGNPTAGHSRASLQTWLVVAAVMGPAVGLCVLAARIWSHRSIAAVLLAAVSGASLALFAVLLKGVAEVAEGGIVAVLTAPELYAGILAAFAGMMFQQSAYRGGRLTASMPTMTVAKPAVGSLLGVSVLGETMQVGDETVFVLVLAVLLMVVATAALARGEAVTVQAHADAITVDDTAAVPSER
ncbi:DMT family transporter [Candidatus Mycobacterium methanotrophicum]|uniref:DMT family transporter n=1 Tax=Candidatus Mycobacterium methanotrophicum TaxID=2943498 RepID=A0ABY4QI40_9MYCO|nr:DMT family transporter [Candidatus Mycobacterium methanotrophicum]UQX10157.1 DMT family transporter [Candidatus Mycobacterium methanotrophicum]